MAKKIQVASLFLAGKESPNQNQ